MSHPYHPDDRLLRLQLACEQEAEERFASGSPVVVARKFIMAVRLFESARLTTTFLKRTYARLAVRLWREARSVVPADVSIER